MRKLSIALFLILTVSMLMAACSPATGPTASPTKAPAAAAAPTTAAAPAKTAEPTKPASTPVAAKPPPKMEKVSLAIPSTGFVDLFTIIAEKKGFYRDEGLEVEKSVVKSDISVKATIGGEIDYNRSIGTALRAAAQGLGMKGILAAQTRPPQLLVARPEYSKVQDLKGKLVAVDAVQGTVQMLLQAILKANGMDPDKDVTTVAMADSATRMQMVKGGAAQAAVLDLALAIKAESEGLRILANAADITERIMGGIATSDKKIKENPDQVLRFVRASVKGLQYMRDPKNRDELIQIMMKEVDVSQPEAARIYDMGIKGFSEDGSVSESALQLEIDDAKAVAGITKDVPISQVFDYSFINKVKQR